MWQQLTPLQLEVLLSSQIDKHPPTVDSFFVSKARLLQPTAMNLLASAEKVEGLPSKSTKRFALLLPFLPLQFP